MEENVMETYQGVYSNSYQITSKLTLTLKACAVFLSYLVSTMLVPMVCSTYYSGPGEPILFIGFEKPCTYTVLRVRET